MVDTLTLLISQGLILIVVVRVIALNRDLPWFDEVDVSDHFDLSSDSDLQDPNKRDNP